MKALPWISAGALAAALAIIVFVPDPAPEPAVPAPRVCSYARENARWIVRYMLAGSLPATEARGAYDLALLEQRQCLIFTAPVLAACQDDGCRAAVLAAGTAVMP